MFCKFCGSKIDDGSAFCTSCGKSLVGANKGANDTLKQAASESASVTEKLVNASETANVTEKLVNSSEASPVVTEKLIDVVAAPVNEKKIPVNEADAETVVKKKSGKGLIAVIIILILLIIGGLVGALIIVPAVQTRSQYMEKIELAEKYLSDCDYEKAIAEYEEAIKIDPKNVDAYVGLANVYMEMGDDDKAMEVLTNIDVTFNDKDQAIIEAKKQEVRDSKKDSKRNSSKDNSKGGSDDAVKYSLKVKVYDANNSSDDEQVSLSGVVVKINEGHNNTDDSSVEIVETDGSGIATFDGIVEGDYTLVFMKDGFVTDNKNVTIEADSSVDKYLSMMPDGNDAVVMIEWNGNQDLDICFFNANTNERISVGNPVDKSGSFIPTDNKATHYERAYLRDIGKSEVRSAYVVDSEVLPGASKMEADGLKISVYTKDGCIYTATADGSHNEAIWYPFYIYEGKVYDDVNSYYTGNEDGYEWAKYSKEGADAKKLAFAEDNEAIVAFEDLMRNNGKFKRRANGKTYKFSQILESDDGWGEDYDHVYYRYLYMDGAQYPALLVTFSADDSVEPNHLPQFSVMLAYENGAIVEKWNYLVDGYYAEVTVNWYKNYMGMLNWYNAFGEEWFDFYKIDDNYNLVKGSPVFIFNKDDIKYFDNSPEMKNWSEADLAKEIERNYKGFTVYYPAPKGMSLEKHIDSLGAKEIYQTEVKKLK